MECFRDEYGGWRFLPAEGGLLDQPGWLMDDLLALKSFGHRIETQIERKRREEKGGNRGARTT